LIEIFDLSAVAQPGVLFGIGQSLASSEFNL